MPLGRPRFYSLMLILLASPAVVLSEPISTDSSEIDTTKENSKSEVTRSPNLEDPLSGPRYSIIRETPDAKDSSEAPETHPLLPVLRYAYERYEFMKTTVRDYRCKVVIRERIQGRLKPHEYLSIKVREQKVQDGKATTPLSIYAKYLGPKRLKGREVLFVQGKNDDKLLGTRGGPRALSDITLSIDPTSRRAMSGHHYPITELGIRNLARRLIEVGIEDIEYDTQKECRVRFQKGAKVNGRVCTFIEVTHPVRRDKLRFHIARIFVDEELGVPIRYAAYTWPTQPGGAPRLMEEYTFIDLELNVGLTEKDFDRTNTRYRFRSPSKPRTSSIAEKESPKPAAEN